MKISHYLLNCFLLLTPILVWNMILAPKLPAAFQGDVFDKNIPSAIVIGENLFRSLVMFLPLLMPINLGTPSQKLGMVVFVAGMLLYFLSWLLLIVFPQTAWSLSLFGFLAPAYTPLIWLIGIGMIGKRLFIEIPYHPWMYVVLSIIFVGFHITHTVIVYLNWTGNSEIILKGFSQ